MKINAPIVIVDDDEDDHYFFRSFCKKSGITAELKFFFDGASALNYLKNTNEKTFIILCDINMPLMGGLNLRRLINSDERLRKQSIPFVFYSTAASPSQVREAYDLTVQGFFIKAQSLEESEYTLKLIFEYWAKSKHPNSVT
jgi:CheY-like chemotaxis protein